MKKIALNLALNTILLCYLLCISTASHGEGSLQLSPLRLSLSDLSSVTTLTVKNRGNSPSLVQIELFKWTQKDGVDYFEPTRDVLVSPPVFTIKPDGEQILRAVIRRKSDANQELTYRLFIREVQDQARPAADNSIKVLLNISIPIFIQPTNAPKQQLIWTVQNVSPDKISLKLNNTGSQHIQIKSFQLQSADEVIVAENKMSYVLPGTSTEWQLVIKSHVIKSPIVINAITDNGELSETITLEHQ